MLKEPAKSELHFFQKNAAHHDMQHANIHAANVAEEQSNNPYLLVARQVYLYGKKQ